jgi:phosphopantetheine adenylyltransferase
VQTALVDWRIAEQSRSLGVRGVRAVADLDRELSPWGTERVFRFPEIPPGLFVARGTR